MISYALWYVLHQTYNEELSYIYSTTYHDMDSSVPEHWLHVLLGISNSQLIMYLWLSPLQRVKEAHTFTSTTNVVPKTTHFTYWCPLSTPINIPNSRGNSHFTGITYSFMMSMTNWAWYVVLVAFLLVPLT